MIVALAVSHSTLDLATATLRSIQEVSPDLEVHVLSVDGIRVPVDGVSVATTDSVDLRMLALTHDDADQSAALTQWWAAELLVRQNRPVLAVSPGVVLLMHPSALVTAPEITVAVARDADAGPSAAALPSVLSAQLCVLGTGALQHAAELQALTADWRSAPRSLDLFVARVPHRVIADDAVLVTRWNTDSSTILTSGSASPLARDGRDVIALDLEGYDPAHPWLFDARDTTQTGPLLSRSPALADVVASAAPTGRAAPVRSDAGLVHSIVRAALTGGDLAADAADRLDDWMLELVPAGDRAPVARYLGGVYETRPDLRGAFPHVPGRDSASLARWALDHGIREGGYDATVLMRAAQRTLEAQPEPEPAGTHRPQGVNLVGYLAGELGVGTSARLMDAALTAAGVPTSTFSVTTQLQSRANAQYRHTDLKRYDLSLVAVNADQTPSVVEALDDVLAGTYRIGMWYWEVESFPADRAHVFAHVDEVWAATDFVRDAIASLSPVPVRSVLPPLPQRSPGEAPPVPQRLGIPADRPWFFFAFDYLSTAERKNPWGLVEAFSRAFAPQDGPVLVIKTINASLRRAESEHLNLLATARDDILVIDEYLQQDELTSLMARCTAYVSLHRSEGLGLTIAEAMAWGRPVVVSAYSGNMQFTNASNAFLVPCAPTPIPANAEPYPAGTPWAAPDLDIAAAHLRRIVDDPEAAGAVGRRAAEDIATLHSPEAAGRRVAAALKAARAVVAEREAAAAASAEATAKARSLRARVGRRLHLR